MSPLAGSLLGVVFGFGSALVPLMNAEAYSIAAVTSTPLLLACTIVALAVGQTAGKLVLYEAARRGVHRLGSTRKLEGLASGRWAQRIRRGLSARRTAVPLVLSSACLGLPPLALVSVAAGAAEHGRRSFALACFLGRVARFAALTIPLVYVGSLS